MSDTALDPRELIGAGFTTDAAPVHGRESLGVMPLSGSDESIRAGSVPQAASPSTASSPNEADAEAWSVSRVVEAPFAFTHLGVHWSGPALDQLQVRSSADGDAWSPWMGVVPEHASRNDEESVFFGALIGADRHRLAQYRLPSAGPRPSRLTVTYLNSLDGPRQPLPPRPAPVLQLKGADLRADIITREEWGADESIRFDAAGAELWERAYVAPRLLVVHHTATRNSSPDPAADVRAIYAFHTISRDWGDIGYNALIDAEGRIYEGRRGRDVDPYGRLERDILSYGVVGAHASGYNYGSASVALLGNFQLGEPTAPAWEALEELLVFQHRRYEVDPRLERDFLRSTDLWRYGLPTLCGHRDCGLTECPGDAVYARLAALRQRVAERIVGDAPPRQFIVSSPAFSLWPGATFSARWTGGAPYDQVLEGFWKHPGADPVDYRTGYTADGLPIHTQTSQAALERAFDEPGQYTLHVQPINSAFADRVSVLVERQVVCDNADPAGTERRGDWTPARSIVGFYGADYEQTETGSDAEFRWTLPAPEAGSYLIQACWAADTDRTRAAHYVVARNGAEIGSASLDQTLQNGVWVTIGTFEFAEGDACTVTLSADTEEERRLVIADAVRIVRQD